jgi:hypothetical protein
MADNKDVLLEPDSEEALKQIAKNEQINITRHSGVGNQKQNIIKAEYHQTNNEVVLNGKTNCLIVLGSDRPAGVNSGQGGAGHTACAAIDIIAGHMGRRPIRDINGVVQKSSKNFELDAARIYISQFCDLDEYFSLPKYFVQVGDIKFDIQESRGRSGIGIKADAVRVVARENIKIVTTHLATNSLNKPVNKGGIDIIAGVDDPSSDAIPQPMVKGDNLVAFLQVLSQQIVDLQANLSNYVRQQQKINSILMAHRHQIPRGVSGEPLEYSDISEACLAIEEEYTNHIQLNLSSVLEKNKYFSASSANYINSKYNRVN